MTYKDVFLKSMKYENPRYLAETALELFDSRAAARVYEAVFCVVQWVVAADFLSEGALGKNLIEHYRDGACERLGSAFVDAAEVIINLYFTYEKTFKAGPLSEDALLEFSRRHSEDAVLYARAARIAEPRLPNCELICHQIQEMEDLGDAIDDIEEDCASGDLNLVNLCVSSGVDAESFLGSLSARRIERAAPRRLVQERDYVFRCVMYGIRFNHFIWR